MALNRISQLPFRNYHICNYYIYIYGIFLRKWLRAFSRLLFLQNAPSILDVYQGSEYASGYTGLSIEGPMLVVLVA